LKILVMGAGAIGIYFGARLYAAGQEVVLCARGENLRQMQATGIELASIRGDLKVRIPATDQPRDFAPYDLILFCVKSYDTEQAAELLRDCLKPGATILTVQNGIDNEAQLIPVFGREAVLTGYARIGAELVGAGKVEHISGGYLTFGEVDGTETSRTRMIAEAFSRAGILGRVSPDIMSERWEKLMGNGAWNTITTLTQRRVGAILDDPEALKLARTVMKEILDVARAEGAHIDDSQIEAYLAYSRDNLRQLKTSTRQDFERGKRLEHEALSGAVVRAARRHGVGVPANETLYALLRLLDGGRQ
jgi:2-dehydropantoate 2-reductase